MAPEDRIAVDGILMQYFDVDPTYITETYGVPVKPKATPQPLKPGEKPADQGSNNDPPPAGGKSSGSSSGNGSDPGGGSMGEDEEWEDED